MKVFKYGGLVGAAALVVLANPALAAGPAQTDVGTYTTAGSHNWTAATKARPGVTPHISFTVWHGAGSVAMNCPFGTAAGTVTSGPLASPYKIGNITSTTWGNSTPNPCKGPAFIDMDVTQIGTWGIYADATPKPTNAVTDNIEGYVGDIQAHVWSKIPGLCEFDVFGTADATFKETDKGGGIQDLVVHEQANTGNLVVDNVVGCLGAISSGDNADFLGTYNVSSADGLINVKP